MKSILLTVLVTALFLIGCEERRSDITSPAENVNTDKLSFLQLPDDIRSGGLGVETVYSSNKWITGAVGGNIQLDIEQDRPGNEFGDFMVHANVDVPPYSFPAQEQWLFTVELDDQYALLNITPSPHTLNNQLVIDFYVQGIDVSGITPETLGFAFITDEGDALPTESTSYFIDYVNHSITIENAVIVQDTTILPGSRYGWVRRAD